MFFERRNFSGGMSPEAIHQSSGSSFRDFFVKTTREQGKLTTLMGPLHNGNCHCSFSFLFFSSSILCMIQTSHEKYVETTRNKLQDIMRKKGCMQMTKIKWKIYRGSWDLNVFSRFVSVTSSDGRNSSIYRVPYVLPNHFSPKPVISAMSSSPRHSTVE